MNFTTSLKIKSDLGHQTSLISTLPRSNHPRLKVSLAKKIMTHVMKFRRVPGPAATCEPDCSCCQLPHLSKVISAVEKNQPVTFVLPAFPGKSPNLNKVLGSLPDMAEKQALLFLEKLMDEIRNIYTPGATIMLCSDGRVFSDVVGMKEADITAYQDALDDMIDELGLKNITTFNLDELFDGNNFDHMREQLMAMFGTPLALLQERVRKGAKPDADRESKDANRMYCGITKFLVEDSYFPGQTKSKTAIQKECKKRSYEVICRSNAWSGLVESLFPNSVRLSIHPQDCGSKKLGIRLIGDENWMTPWHGVAVETDEGFILLKKLEAEAKGASLVKSVDGTPSHYELKSGNILRQAGI